MPASDHDQICGTVSSFSKKSIACISGKSLTCTPSPTYVYDGVQMNTCQCLNYNSIGSM